MSACGVESRPFMDRVRAQVTRGCQGGTAGTMAASCTLSLPMTAPLREMRHRPPADARLQAVADVLVSTDERYRTLMERVRIIAWEADPRTWQFTFVSPQAQAITGIPAAQWLKHDFWPA